MIWKWNVPPQDHVLSALSPVCGIIVEALGNRNRPYEVIFTWPCHCFLVLRLVSTQRHRQSCSPHHAFFIMVNCNPLKPWANINLLSLKTFLSRVLKQQREKKPAQYCPQDQNLNIKGKIIHYSLMGFFTVDFSHNYSYQDSNRLFKRI